MKIYAIENDLRNLLLVDGLDVINGRYTCTQNKDETLSIPYCDKHAYYVMEAPKPKKEEGVYYYNTVLGEAEEILIKEGKLKP